MGTSDEDQGNNNVYPDWAAMQPYYGPGVAVQPYFNSAVVGDHAPHPYMWVPPQPAMPLYGTPYAAIYAHGGVYSHPGVPLAAMLNMETATKSTGNTDKGFMNKLKGFDRLAMSMGNRNVGPGEEGVNHVHSQSEETEGSSDESGRNTAKASQNARKRSREETLTIGRDKKTETRSSAVPVGKSNGSPDKVMGFTVPTGVTANSVGSITPLELRNTSRAKAGFTRPCAMTSNEAWLQNDRELKQEKRKQSNRESARRSRMKKQAEAEDLAKSVESLTTENMTLRSEINQLTESSETLKLENARLTEKLKDSPAGQTEERILIKVSDNKEPVSTENLLSRVDNSGSPDRSDEGVEMYKKNSGTNLHRLPVTGPRADAVAAS